MTGNPSITPVLSLGSDVVGESDQLRDLLEVVRQLRAAWDSTRSEADRLAMREAWDIASTCPGSRYDGGPDRTAPWDRCTPTVLEHDTGIDTNHMAFRGACLGCGWVAEQTHLLWDGGENAAAEDANDHSHPGWRTLPVVERPPHRDGGTGYSKAVTAWRARWEPILPQGWLDHGGPIRTQRCTGGTRHVPSGSPGGGYDMSAEASLPEAPGGQLGFF